MAIVWNRYGAGLAIVALAIVVRYALHPWLGSSGFFLFWAAMLTAAWVGGFGPSIVTQTVILVAESYWFSLRTGERFPSSATDWLIVASFYGVGCTIGVLSDLRRAAQQRARMEHQEAVSQREQLRATLSCMADGVLVADAKGHLTLMNPAAEAMTGWSLAEARGKPLWEVFTIRKEDSEHSIAFKIDVVLSDGQTVHDASRLSLMTRLGRPIPVAYSAAAIRDASDGVTGAVLIFRDESERRRTEQALRNADKRKDEFLATLAHELRNPLAPICMGLELLNNAIDDPAESAEIRGMLIRQSQHMVRLIDDLLDVSRITRGRLELRKCQVELADVIRNAVEATRPLIESGHQQLVLDLPDKPIRLYADPNRLTQVFSNLLNNAAKYTPSEGRIELSAAHDGRHVVVTVADTGIGIPADKLGYIFEMFTQVEGTEERIQSGLGIGLTLVRRLVEMHGGSVEVQSDGEKLGSKFSVRVPILPLPEEARTPRDDDTVIAAVANSHRVLVVDDNVDALDSLSMLVALMGNEICKARDGLEAVRAAETFRPDIVLMDLGMPNLNGYEAAKRMREEPWGRELTLVATSGWGQDEHRRLSREAGFDHHLVKPVDLAALQSVLQAPGVRESLSPAGVKLHK
jgi:PAS domain S-box-containing protein